MIEENAVTCEYAVSFAIVHRDPVHVQFGHTIGRARIERRALLLGDLLNRAVKLGCRSLVEACLPLQAKDPDRLEQAQHAGRISICSIFRGFRAHADVALGGKVVDLGRPDLLDQADQIGRIGHVAIVHQKRHIRDLPVLIEMIDARGIEGRGPPLDAMHDISER